MCGYVDASYWRDMGTPEDFVRGSADLVRGIAPSPALGGHRGEQLVHDGAAVSPGALLIGGTVVGRGAEIGPGARLDGAVIFDGVRIEAGSVIERSIIGFGARIGPRALIRDGVIGDGADIGARCELLRGARVWPGVHIPDGGIRYSSDVLSALDADTPAPRRCRAGNPSIGHHRKSTDSSLIAICAAGRRPRHELQVEVTGRHPQRAGERVDVDRGQVGCDPQAVDAGFFGGLPQRCRHDVGVGILAVPAQLDPPPQPRMQRQQHLTAGVVEHQRRRRDVARHAFPKAGVLPGVQERQHGVAQ